MPVARSSGPRAVALLVAGCLLGSLLAGGAVAQGSPTLSVDDATVRVDGTGSVAVRLSAAPDGVAGYEVRLRLADPGVATVTNVTYPDAFDITNTTVADDGAAVRLKAIDLSESVQAGARNVTLARLRVRGDAAGTTAVAIAAREVDDDRGETVDAATAPGRVEVLPAATSPGGGTATEQGAGTTRQTTAGDASPSPAAGGSTGGSGTPTTAILAGVGGVIGGMVGAVAIMRWYLDGEE